MMIGKETSSQRINRWHIIIERWPASLVIRKMSIEHSETHHNKTIRMATHTHTHTQSNLLIPSFDKDAHKPLLVEVQNNSHFGK